MGPPNEGKRMMRFYTDPFLESKQISHDKARDQLCNTLRSLGVDARVFDRGNEINIRKGSISWAHVYWIEKKEAGPHMTHVMFYYTQYGVPDSRLSGDFYSTKPKRKWDTLLVELYLAEWKTVEPQIKSFRRRSFPLFGRVVDLHWKGNDLGLGIVERLNNDMSIKHPLMTSVNVEILADHDLRCWTITIPTWDPPSAELWDCYQRIAGHLLAEWPSS